MNIKFLSILLGLTLMSQVTQGMEREVVDNNAGETAKTRNIVTPDQSPDAGGSILAQTPSEKTLLNPFNALGELMAPETDSLFKTPERLLSILNQWPTLIIQSSTGRSILHQMALWCLNDYEATFPLVETAVNEYRPGNKDLRSTRDKDNKTPLHLALFDLKTLQPQKLSLKHLPLIKLLITSESVNIQDNLGRTALHYAALLNEEIALPVIDALIENGATLKINDTSGEMPVTLAHRKGATPIYCKLVKLSSAPSNKVNETSQLTIKSEPWFKKPTTIAIAVGVGVGITALGYLAFSRWK